MAKKFRVFYPRYEALHKQVLAQGENKDTEMMANLMEMHHRLENMKRQIWAGEVDREEGS
jgi:RNA polymerase II elongation factor ELL